jgi:hypothetical protein
MPGDVIANLAYIQARMDHQDEETTNRERQVTRNTNPHLTMGGSALARRDLQSEEPRRETHDPPGDCYFQRHQNQHED